MTVPLTQTNPVGGMKRWAAGGDAIMKNSPSLIVVAAALCLAAVGFVGAQVLVVPTEIQLPGTQPGQVSNLETPDKCDNCHGGYNRAVEPAFNWRGA
ncbi:MAG: hypothetical protein A3F77_05285 [Betaproteobacteria bacterium RIFCSPLOWO2_12_FULL_67_28]|nr:MAG: hypothetical protein A3F77_05285 [Betaproteobacteria bacterium RIFCSPLOWO2_12_FULL_67_28]